MIDWMNLFSLQMREREKEKITHRNKESGKGEVVNEEMEKRREMKKAMNSVFTIHQPKCEYYCCFAHILYVIDIVKIN